MSLRLKLLYWFYDRAIPVMRSRRMAFFARTMGIRPGLRVLDLGGTSYNWQWLPVPLDITILNLPGIMVDYAVAGPHRFHFVEGDATDMPHYADESFDIIFSNSVIEHVGGPERQAAFAREARRLGRAYYVQTPSKYFPLEAHTGLPFWWYYPESLKQRFYRKWEQSLPAWGEMVRGTTVLSAPTLRRFFPDGRLYVERVAGLPKSYTMFRALDT